MRRVVMLLVLALIFSGCGSDSEEPTTTITATTTSLFPSSTGPDGLPVDTPDSTSFTITTGDPTTPTSSFLPTTTTEPPPASPLNGLPITDPLSAERRVMAVKIDNHENARPQSGLEQAEAVYEIPVEGRFTRFISLWHQRDSDYLGPLRSGRPTDAAVLKPLGATFTISGAQGWVISRINAAGVPLIGEVRPATFRISERYAPHNLYVNTSLLRDYADERGFSDHPPPPLWEFGPMSALEDIATEIVLDFDSENVVSWIWGDGSYRRLVNGFIQQWVDQDENTGILETEVLVVLFARRYYARPGGGSGGTSVPAFETTGSGRALIAAGGQIIEGVWERQSENLPFTLTDTAGQTLPVPPGKPWITIFPDDRSVTW